MTIAIARYLPILLVGYVGSSDRQIVTIVAGRTTASEAKLTYEP